MARRHRRVRFLRWLAWLPLLPALGEAAADPQILGASTSSPATRLCNIVAVDVVMGNFGDMEATNTLLTVTLPLDWVFVPEDPADPRITVIPGNPVVIQCDVGVLAPSQFPSCRIRAKANTTGVHQIQTSLSSPDDTNLLNNDRNSTFIVGPPAAHHKNPNINLDDGDPVGTFAGNFHLLEAADIDLFGPLRVFLQRYYDSALGDDGVVQSALGDNWQHNFDVGLDVDGTDATVAFHRGRILRFTDNAGDWDLVERTDIGFQLVTQGAEFRLADPRSQLMYLFDTQGLLIRIEDGRGNVLTLTYAGSLLQTVSDGLGRTLTFAYDASDRLMSVTDGTRTVQFGHTGGNLTSVTDADDKTTVYAYDPANPHSTALMTSRTGAEGNTPFTQVYDMEGRVMSQTTADSHTTLFDYSQDVDTYRTETADPLGHVLAHLYTPNGELAQLIDQAGEPIRVFRDAQGRRSNVIDREGQSTRPAYDSATGLPIRISHPGIGNDAFTYVPRIKDGVELHGVESHTHPDGRTNLFAYDADGNLTDYTLRDMETFTFTHNSRGQVETITNPTAGVATFTYDGNGRMSTVADSDAFTGTTTLHYDALHRLTDIERPDTFKVTFGYDPLNRLTSVTDERTNATTFTYDDNGRLTTITDPFLEETGFEYDDLNRLSRYVDRHGEAILFAYGERGLPASITNRNNDQTQLSFDSRRRLVGIEDPGNHVTAFDYDNEGRLVSITNPLSQSLDLARDPMGYVSSLTNALGHTLSIGRDAMKRVSSVVNPLGEETTFTHTLRGQLQTVTHEFPAGGDLTATYSYDELGNLINLKDPNNRNWQFTYTPIGRLDSFGDPNLENTAFDYDTQGRLETVTYPDAATATLSYDAASNVVGVLFADGTNLEFTYDALNRMETATDGPETVTFTYDAVGRLTNTQSAALDFGAGYDPGDRLTSVTYPDPGGVGGPVTVTYDYDSENRLTQVSDDLTGTVLTFAYDDADRLTGIMRPNGVHTTYTHNAGGQLTRIQEGTIIDLQFTLDAAGRIARTDFVAAPLDPAGVLSGDSASFAFDNASRISGGGHAYDSRNRLTSSPTHTFSWDDDSRLTSMDAIDYDYDALGNVVTRTEGGNTTRFYFNEALGRRPVVAQRDVGGGQFERFHVWSPGGRLLYLISLPGHTVRHAHFDQIGSILALTDEAGSVTDSYAYTPYGTLLGRTGTDPQPFLFNGAFGVRSDGDLCHMQARWYDPASGRFLTPEPLWPVLNEPRQHNIYQFALQNPLSFADPRGTDPDNLRADDPEVVAFGSNFIVTASATGELNILDVRLPPPDRPAAPAVRMPSVPVPSGEIFRAFDVGPLESAAANQGGKFLGFDRFAQAGDVGPGRETLSPELKGGGLGSNGSHLIHGNHGAVDRQRTGDFDDQIQGTDPDDILISAYAGDDIIRNPDPPPSNRITSGSGSHRFSDDMIPTPAGSDVIEGVPGSRGTFSGGFRVRAIDGIFSDNEEVARGGFASRDVFVELRRNETNGLIFSDYDGGDESFGDVLNFGDLQPP